MIRWIFSERRAKAVEAWKEWTKGMRGDTPSQEFAAGFALGVIYREREEGAR